jgi:N-formylglutamate deformylase
MPPIVQSGAVFAQAATQLAVPVIFDSPHSGFVFPPDFRPTATREQIQTTWDAYVDELCVGAVDFGAGLIAAAFPRAYIDVNRAADDIDPEILTTPWPKQTRLSEHGRRGMGLIRRLALPSVPMYDRTLEVTEVAHRIDEYFAPYRHMLHATINAAWRDHGAVWHFNCHSMKSRGNAMNRDSGSARPDFVIGDRHGTTATPELTQWVADFFGSHGFTVRINDPYAGADIVRFHGKPARRRYSIQIEINRSLYMHEPTCERGAGFNRVRDTMTEFARAIVQRVRGEITSRR